jgi:hypothetical protein
MTVEDTHTKSAKLKIDRDQVTLDRLGHEADLWSGQINNS